MKKLPKYGHNDKKTKKNKVTFIYPTFKVETIKVVLFFKYTAVLAIFQQFFAISFFSLKNKKMANIWGG